MTGWDRVITRYRRLNGLTQAAFGELLGVEQATVSRWERGFHAPELSMQIRLRKLIGREFVASDDIIIHRVRNSLSAAKLADASGRNLAASLRAAQLHGVTREYLEGLEYHRFFTDVLTEQWQIARDCGFFDGEVASIHVFNTWVPACGGAVKYCEGFWTPVFLTGGEVMLASEFNEIDACAYSKVSENGRVDIVTVEELVR